MVGLLGVGLVLRFYETVTGAYGAPLEINSPGRLIQVWFHGSQGLKLCMAGTVTYSRSFTGR